MHMATIEGFTKKDLLFSNCFQSNFPRRAAKGGLSSVGITGTGHTCWGNATAEPNGP